MPRLPFSFIALHYFFFFFFVLLWELVEARNKKTKLVVVAVVAVLRLNRARQTITNTKSQLKIRKTLACI